MLSDLARQSLAALRMLIVFTVILGVGYPLAVWSVAQPFGERADGQPLRLDGKVVGSALIGQDFTGDRWFHSRPSPNDYDTLASAPSNLGPLNTDLLTAIRERRVEIASAESVSEADVPADAVAGSASGLDPHISPTYAEIQVARVAQSNGLSINEVAELIDENTDGRFLGFHGEAGVNVVKLNLAVAQVRR